MNLRSTVLIGATLLSLAAPLAAQADPEWGRGDHDGWREHDGWHDHEGRGHEWREHEWREHEGWEHRGYGYGWGYAPRCIIENRGYYTWYGEYVYRSVRVCR